MIYVQFLETNIVNFNDEWSRRSYQVFSKLSNLIKTKTQKQCKGHHQKILFGHKTIENIIRYYKAEKHNIKLKESEL